MASKQTKGKGKTKQAKKKEPRPPNVLGKVRKLGDRLKDNIYIPAYIANHEDFPFENGEKVHFAIVGQTLVISKAPYESS